MHFTSYRDNIKTDLNNLNEKSIITECLAISLSVLFSESPYSGDALLSYDLLEVIKLI